MLDGYPLFVQVTCNGQDYTDSGITFLYQADASVRNISLVAGLDPSGSSLFITGEHFVNSTALSCRVGGSNTRATFLSSTLVLCFVPRSVTAMTLDFPAEAGTNDETRGLGPRKGDNFSPGAWLGPEDGEGMAFYVEVTPKIYNVDRVRARLELYFIPACRPRVP